MPQIVECVINISEGRRERTLELFEAAVEKLSHSYLIDVSSDPDHNRSVLTLVGRPEPLVRAALAITDVAVREIDLSHHRGVHPRIGAVDVVPFVPLQEVTMQRCVQLAREFGREAAERFQLPIYYYGEAAISEDRRKLSHVRRGQFEGLRVSIAMDKERVPDEGPSQVHHTAGAVAVGARPILIAFNVYLGNDELSLARELARRVRESNGGLPAVQAMGFAIPSRERVQVSMNLIDFRRTPLSKVMETLRLEGERMNVELAESELVGMIPEAAFEGGKPEDFGLTEFDPTRILERRIRLVTGWEVKDL